jgi:hypothetical protein
MDALIFALTVSSDAILGEGSGEADSLSLGAVDSPSEAGGDGDGGF